MTRTPARGMHAAQPRSLEALGDTVDGLYLVDHRQRIVRWNAGAERLLGTLLLRSFSTSATK